MKLLVTDTNVFIDILRLGKGEEFFCLKQEVHTTQFVAYELKDEQKDELQKYIENGQLIVKSFDSKEVSEVMELEISRRSVSKRIADRSVLYYALKDKGILISGDKSLKNEAEDKGLEAHGTIWVVSEMYRQEVINVSETIQLLEELKEVNPYLPEEDIDLTIKRIKVK